MKKLIVVVLVVLSIWQYNKYKSNSYSPPVNNATPSAPVTLPTNSVTPPSISSSFKCDGRTHCSQMTSCEEATFFLKNCPNVKMDGDGNGIPCEKQWCKR